MQDPFATLDSEFNTLPTSLPEASIEPSLPVERDDASNVEDGGMDNKDYVVNEMKSLIMGARDVIERLDADIKIGSSPRHYEVYGKLMDSAANAIGKLADIESADRKLKNAKSRTEEAKTVASTNNVQNNIVFEGTSTDMLAMLKSLRKQALKEPV